MVCCILNAYLGTSTNTAMIFFVIRTWQWVSMGGLTENSHTSSEDTLLGPDFLLPLSPYAPASVSKVTQSPLEPREAVKMAAWHS